MDIGKELQYKREQLGISLEKIEHLTKIQKRYLRAIEIGDWSKLPEFAYTRGFIVSYARAVGMELSELQIKFNSVEDNLKASSHNNNSGTVQEEHRSYYSGLINRIINLFKIARAKS